ncbi:MAG: hypothetical protein P4K93_02955 [Terracidiphilus sp.]|nr:hypothetical protein [Terracidiphilus sp.]MDR3797083.1 hypothetical protein [Terracidiphilus sp.]
MKTARFFAMAILAAASIPLLAQDTGADGSQKAVYAPQGPMGFGDASQSHSWEMSLVTCDLEGKLDSKTAKVGDRVVLKTNDKVQTADGTVIPRGTRLVGRVIQVQTQDGTHNVAQLAIAIDRAELKNGQSIAIYTLIRGVHPRRIYSDTNPLANADPTRSPATGGRGSRNGNAQTGVFSDEMQRVSPTTTSVGDRAGTDTDPNPQEAVEFAGRGDLDETNAHRLAAARAVPRPTAIPGVLLAGSSTASGVFLSRQKDIEIESGTEMHLGIIGQ